MIGWPQVDLTDDEAVPFIRAAWPEVLTATWPHHVRRLGGVTLKPASDVATYPHADAAGSRNDYAALDLSGPEPRADAPDWFRPATGAHLAIPAGWAVIERVTAHGRAVGVSIYCNPLDAGRLLRRLRPGAAPKRAGRQRGHARFEPYYKVQWYDETTLAWRDVQIAHGSEADARAAYPPGRRCRTMRVAMDGRGPVAGSELRTPGVAASCPVAKYRRHDPRNRVCGEPAGWHVHVAGAPYHDDNLPRCLACCRRTAEALRDRHGLDVSIVESEPAA